MTSLAPSPMFAGSLLLFGVLIVLLAAAAFHARERRRWTAVAALVLAGVAVAGLLAATTLPVMIAGRPPVALAPQAPIESVAGVGDVNCEGTTICEHELALDVSPPMPEGFEEDWPVPPMGLGPDFDREIRRAIKSVRKTAADAGDYCRAWSTRAGAVAASTRDGASSTVKIESEWGDGPKRDRGQESPVRMRAAQTSLIAESPAIPTPARRVIYHAAQFFCFSLLLVLAYLFVDAGRRRRYTWLRRFAIAGAFIVACVLIWRSNPLFLV